MRVAVTYHPHEHADAGAPFSNRSDRPTRVFVVVNQDVDPPDRRHCWYHLKVRLDRLVQLAPRHRGPLAACPYMQVVEVPCVQAGMQMVAVTKLGYTQTHVDGHFLSHVESTLCVPLVLGVVGCTSVDQNA